MTDSSTGPGAHVYHDLAEDMRREFIDETMETLQSLDVLLDNGRHGRAEEINVVDEFRRAALKVRGQASALGLRLMSTVARRLDDYLAQAPDPLPPRAWDDLQIYLDQLSALAIPADESVVESSVVVRALPRKLGFDVKDIEIRDVEVMLVMPHGAQTRFVEREMQQCGYRTMVVTDTIDAFGLVVQTKPNLVVVSALMPDLDGIDLAIALVSMPSTRNIPIAVITSLDPGDDRLAQLPRKVPVLHKGASFGDDLFKALDNLFLI